MASFKTLPSRSVSHLSNTNPSDSASTKTGETGGNGEMYFDFEQKKATIDNSVGGMLSWNNFHFPEGVCRRLREYLSVGKIDETSAVHVLFKFNLLVFETRFITGAQVTRYSVLCHAYNTLLPVDSWQKANKLSQLAYPTAAADALKSCAFTRRK